MANQSCNLECLKDKVGDDVLEFVGPVKIILVEPSKFVYCTKVFKAAALLMAQILLGVTTITVLFYTMSYKREDMFKSLHVLLCTIGMQIFVPFAILSVKPLNGSAAPAKVSHRRLEHILLHICGCVCLGGGTFAVFLSGYPTLITPHSCLGAAVIVLICLSAFCGILFSCFMCDISLENMSKCRRCIYIVHKIFGIVTIMTSSACLISALIKKPFVEWLPLPEMYYFYLAFCVYYTVVIVLC